jgi:ribosomal protein S18 acetylase RimI-like enzyme
VTESTESTEPVTVRPATDADVESFHSCVDAVARERRWLAMIVAPPLAATRQFRRMLRDGGGVDLVAVTDAGTVVGWTDVQRIPWEGMRHVGALGMGVLAPYRGRGLGRALLREALDAAARAGITRVELDVYASNARAMSLYQAEGFVEEGRKRGARILDGRTEDLVVMARLRAAAPDP